MVEMTNPGALAGATGATQETVSTRKYLRAIKSATLAVGARHDGA